MSLRKKPMTPPSPCDGDTSPALRAGAASEALRLLICLLLFFVLPSTDACSLPGDRRYVSIAFYDVVDRPDQLESDAVTGTSLAQFFDWLKGTGWIAVSLDDLAAAARGVR